MKERGRERKKERGENGEEGERGEVGGRESFSMCNGCHAMLAWHWSQICNLVNIIKFVDLHYVIVTLSYMTSVVVVSVCKDYCVHIIHH